MRIAGGCGERARISATKAEDAGIAKWARTASRLSHSSTNISRSGFSTSTWQLCARHPASPRDRALCSAPSAIMRSRCSGVRMTWPVIRIIDEKSAQIFITSTAIKRFKSSFSSLNRTLSPFASLPPPITLFACTNTSTGMPS